MRGSNKMENYKKVVKSRIWMLSLIVILAVGLAIFDVFWASDEMKESTIYGFQSGVIDALGILAAIFLIRYKKLLHNEKELKIQYNKENDERMKAIKAKAGMPILLITSLAMMIAGVIAGYFNFTIFTVLIITSVCQLLVSLVVKLIYTKIM